MNAVKAFRIVSLIEGLSYLLLMFVAMPLKYIFEQPIYVRIVGSAHGFLFIAFVAVLIWATIARRWGLLTPALYFVLSMIPFGFLLIEYLLRRDLHPPEPA